MRPRLLAVGTLESLSAWKEDTPGRTKSQRGVAEPSLRGVYALELGEEQEASITAKDTTELLPRRLNGFTIDGGKPFDHRVESEVPIDAFAATFAHLAAQRGRGGQRS